MEWMWGSFDLGVRGVKVNKGKTHYTGCDCLIVVSACWIWYGVGMVLEKYVLVWFLKLIVDIMEAQVLTAQTFPRKKFKWI